MERRCRLSAVQAEQALGYVHTWHQRLCSCHRYTLYPPRLPQASSVLPPLASCAALEPRTTHHPPLVISSPSARSVIRRDSAAGTHPSRPERPALTLTLLAFGRRCELIVQLAEPKLFVTITNVPIGSDTL